MSKIKDHTGKKFTRLTCVEYVGSDSKGDAKWKCLCDCGNEKIVYARRLLSGDSKSCGCLHKEKTTHQMSNTKMYRAWRTMITRCTNPNAKKYQTYGARGITVCPRWLSFDNFLADMGERPTDNHSLERKDNDGNYEPNNCIWADKFAQANNRRNNKMVCIGGETLTLRQACIKYNKPYNTVNMRLFRGKSVEEAFDIVSR